jgi:hypothetical protein
VTKPPAEVVASLLAVTTMFVPNHLPPWAIFIAWAGTFAAGGPRPDVLKKIWTVMPIGAITAFLIASGFDLASKTFTGTTVLVAQCVILFVLNGSMMLLGRLQPFSFVPGMFFGFASYFATLFGGFGFAPGNALAALGSVLLMNALGPLYAWLTATLGEHRHAPGAAPDEPAGREAASHAPRAIA